MFTHLFGVFSGDGRESRREYTQMICDSNPAIYQLSHYLYDDFDVNGDHHLDIEDYEGFFANMDEDGTRVFSSIANRSIRVELSFFAVSLNSLFYVSREITALEIAYLFVSFYSI